MSHFFLILGFAAIIFFCSALWLLSSLIIDERRSATAKRISELSTPQQKAAVVINMEQMVREPLLLVLPHGIRKAIEAKLEATGHALSVKTILIISGLTAFITVILLTWMFGRLTWITGLLTPVAAILVPLALLSLMKARHDNRFLTLFPDAIDLIVRAVRAGLPIPGAIDSVGREMPDPVGHEFRVILSDTRIGVDLEEALRRAARRVNKLEFSFFVASIVLQRETGGNLSETLSTLAHVLRRRAELRLKARAMTSEARTSALVIGALPFFAGAGLAFFSPQYFSVLLHDPRGNWLLGGGLLSLIFGGLVMNYQIKWAMR